MGLPVGESGGEAGDIRSQGQSREQRSGEWDVLPMPGGWGGSGGVAVEGTWVRAEGGREGMCLHCFSAVKVLMREKSWHLSVAIPEGAKHSVIVSVS